MSLQHLIYIGLGLLLIYGLFTVGLPFLLALFLVVLLEPLVQILAKKLKINRPISAIIVSFTFTFVFFLSFFLVILQASKEAVGLSVFLVKLIKRMAANIEVFINNAEVFIQSLTPEYQAGISQVLEASVNTLQGFFASLAEFSIYIAATIPNFFLETLIFFIAFYIISFKLPDLKKGFLSLFDESTHTKVEKLMNTLYRAVIGFIGAQIVISILIFIITTVGLSILKIRYAIATALLITIVDILPILGTGSVLIPMSIYHFILGDSFTSIGLLILYGTLVVFRRIVEPKILGDAIGIGAFSTLVSMYLGFKFVGFIGIFMGPAVIIIFKALLNEEIIKINIKF
ncbi:MAG: sporulation integral membrane protein YtvI [Clostridia bacterium]|nr:sporulation integral membrane protein YtvI [Clostridia bacterium]